MGMTIDEAIKQLETYTIPCGKYKVAYDLAVETMCKYQQLQADYENRLKADMVAILEDLKSEFDMMSDSVVEGRTVTITSWRGMQKRICNIIQQKINALKGGSND